MSIRDTTTTTISLPEKGLEWLNFNMHRNYPIVDTTIVESITGAYLPSSFLVDLQLVVPYVEGIDSSRFFISSVVRNASSLQVTIGYMVSEPGANVLIGFDCAVSSAIPIDLVYTGGALDATHTIKLSAITTAATYTSSTYTYGIPEQYAALKNLRGALYIGTCADMTDISAMQFSYNNSAIMPMCVFVESPEDNVTSIRFVDDYGTDVTMTDDFTLDVADGIKIVVNEDKTKVTFEIDADYINDQVANQLASVVGNPIRSINGQPPDSTGNFVIAGEDCTLLTTNEHSIAISNPCAKPCCDQDGVETAEILKALTDLTSAKTVLNNYYTDLATKVNSMQARLSALIASRR